MGGGVSTSVASRSGDASAGLTVPFLYNAAFQVGGSGKQDLSSSASQDTSGSGLSSAGGASNNALLYIGIGISAIALIVVLVK